MNEISETIVRGFKVRIIEKCAFEAAGFSTFARLDGASISSFIRRLTGNGDMDKLASTLNIPQQIWVCLSGNEGQPNVDCRCTVCVERTDEHDFTLLSDNELLTLQIPPSTWAVFEVGADQSPTELYRAGVYDMIGKIGYAFNDVVGLHFDNEHEWKPGKSMCFMLPVKKR